MQLDRRDEHTHVYEPGSDVVVWTSTVGPLANRQETYKFSQLPFCKGTKTLDHYHESIGEALLGLELETSGYDLQFNRNSSASLCTSNLTIQDTALFEYAIRNNYWYSLYMDNLPIWGPVGRMDNDTSYLYTHREFKATYKQDHIIDVTLVNSGLISMDPSSPVPVSFTYNISWTPTTTTFDDRFSRYLDADFFNHKVLLI